MSVHSMMTLRCHSLMTEEKTENDFAGSIKAALNVLFPAMKI